MHIYILLHLFTEVSSDALEPIGEFRKFLFESDSSGRSWQEVAKNWQTLIAGVIAFVPTSLAAIFVWKQVNDQRIQSFKAQEAAALKARLRLSQNISCISLHLDCSYDRLLKNDFSYEYHVFPDRAVEDVLEACIVSRSSNFKFFQKYVENIQTYASLCRIYSDLGGEDNMVKCFKLLGEIDVQTDRLYPFSRFEVDKIDEKPVTIEEVRSQLKHNLRRNKNISGTNLEKLLSFGHFDRY